MRAEAADSADRIVARGERVHLRHLVAEDQEPYMVAASRALHHPWTSPPADEQGFQGLVARSRAPDFVSLVGWKTADGLLTSVVNFSQIVRGGFHSCCCGFYANAAAAGQGLTRETLELALGFALATEKLHRVEANVQPNNAASLALVRRVGFRHEGFSPRYLHIDGE